MNIVQRILKNTGAIIVGDIIFRIISLIITIYLARYLGTDDFGKYNSIFAYLALLTILTDLGLRQILVREMSRDRLKTPILMGNVCIIKLILTSFSVITAIFALTLISHSLNKDAYICIASLYLFSVSFTDFYAAIFQADLKMEYNIVAKLISKVSSAILIFIIIFLEGTFLQIIFAIVLSEMIKTLISYLFSRKIVKLKLNIDLSLSKHLVKEALPLAFSSIIWIIYFRIDVVMLSIMQGDTSVGLYSAAQKLYEPLSLIPYALMLSLYPIMSASFEKSISKLQKIYEIAFKYLFIVMLPICIGGTFLAEKIILAIYGMEFIDSIITLQIFMWSLMFMSMGYVVSNLLLSIDRQKLYMVSSFSCAIVNISLNLVFIPVLSHNGAAITTVFTYFIFFFLNFYFVSRQIQLPPMCIILLKPIIGGLVMAAFLYYFINIFNTFLLILFAGMVYSVTLITLKSVSKEELHLFTKKNRKDLV